MSLLSKFFVVLPQLRILATHLVVISLPPVVVRRDRLTFAVAKSFDLETFLENASFLLSLHLNQLSSRPISTMASDSTRSWDLYPVTEENSKTTIPDLLDLIKALALYEKDPDAVEATPELLRNALFGEEAKGGRKYAECVLAYRGEPGKEGSEPVGMAVYLYVLPL